MPLIMPGDAVSGSMADAYEVFAKADKFLKAAGKLPLWKLWQIGFYERLEVEIIYIPGNRPGKYR